MLIQPLQTVLQNAPSLSTGLPTLDSILDGGIRRNSILEVSFVPGAGSDALDLILNVVLEVLEAGERILWIQMGSLFPIRKLVQLDRFHGPMLDQIAVITISSLAELTYLFSNKLKKQPRGQDQKYGLIVLEDLASLVNYSFHKLTKTFTKRRAVVTDHNNNLEAEKKLGISKVRLPRNPYSAADRRLHFLQELMLMVSSYNRTHNSVSLLCGPLNTTNRKVGKSNVTQTILQPMLGSTGVWLHQIADRFVIFKDWCRRNEFAGLQVLPHIAVQANPRNPKTPHPTKVVVFSRSREGIIEVSTKGRNMDPETSTEREAGSEAEATTQPDLEGRSQSR
ncbi:hypothetical protein LJB42_001801 [Komagataella kurtzmanii]|nr:hypothetical protein LJB42_001801 [Komagataella kurtzmanii]